MTPRRWFHLLLGAIFIPFLSLPLVLLEAVRHSSWPSESSATAIRA